MSMTKKTIKISVIWRHFHDFMSTKVINISLSLFIELCNKHIDIIMLHFFRLYCNKKCTPFFLCFEHIFDVFEKEAVYNLAV